MRTGKYLIGMVAAAIITAGLFALVVNLLDRRQEAKIQSLGTGPAESVDHASDVDNANAPVGGQTTSNSGR